jgi:hypothetical protein
MHIVGLYLSVSDILVELNTLGARMTEFNDKLNYLSSTHPALFRLITFILFHTYLPRGDCTNSFLVRIKIRYRRSIMKTCQLPKSCHKIQTAFENLLLSERKTSQLVFIKNI